MALFIIANSGKVSYGIKQYLCDTIDDIPFEDNIAPGSTVYVVDSKKTYMYNSKGQWVEIITGGGSGGASALSGLSDVALDQLQDGEYLVYDEAEDKWVNTDYSDRKIALGKLPAGETTVTISDENLTLNSTIEVWTSIDGVNYSSIVVNNGSVVLTYPVQESDMKVKIVFFNDTDYDFINSIKNLKMTNNSYTDNNGYKYTVSASSERFPAYYVFNGRVNQDGWRPSDFSTNGWVMLELPEYCKVLKHTIYMHFDGNATTKILFQGSNDGSTFNTVETIDLGNTSGGDFERIVETNSTGLYKYYRWYYETNTGRTGTYIIEIAFNDVNM